MRGARLICFLLSRRPKYRGRQRVVVRSRLTAPVSEVRIACEVQRGERAVGKIDLGEIALGDVGDGV